MILRDACGIADEVFEGDFFFTNPFSPSNTLWNAK
ncbi:MAG: hypothetical protein ACJAYJ_003312 [Saprospiraceae bacterium]|jgi:hypothetical protein